LQGSFARLRTFERDIDRQGPSARISAVCASAGSGGLQRCKCSQQLGYCCALHLAAHPEPQCTLAGSMRAEDS